MRARSRQRFTFERLVLARPVRFMHVLFAFARFAERRRTQGILVSGVGFGFRPFVWRQFLDVFVGVLVRRFPFIFEFLLSSVNLLFSPHFGFDFVSLATVFLFFVVVEFRPSGNSIRRSLSLNLVMFGFYQA
jgi:hypothetical protein